MDEINNANSMITTYLAGFGISLSLILAIGSQNAFVLKQGLKKQHVFITCLICALSDALLISLGTFGFAKVIEQYTTVISITKYLGALFLFVYGLKSLHSAITASDTLNPAEESQASIKQTIAMCLAFTWLNPHVYLDTILLIGGVSTNYHTADNSPVSFTLGAITASWLFFFSLGYGARLLEPIFKKVIAWRILDACIAVVMWLIALSLLVK